MLVALNLFTNLIDLYLLILNDLFVPVVLSALVSFKIFSLMFWTNWNEQRPSIMRSTLAGNNIKVVISIDVFTPNGLTIDNKAEKIYFSDGSLGKIERCEYDGSNRHVSTPAFLFIILQKTLNYRIENLDYS